MMSTVLVTGGNGFIGSHVVDQLAARGQDVISFDLFPRQYEAAPDGASFIQGNLGDEGLIRRILVDSGVDVVVHAAWTSIHETSLKDPAADLDANLVPMIRLLEACRDAGVRRVVFLSSGGQVYGIPGETPVKESHPTHPISAYGVAKLAAEKYLGMYTHLYGLESVILRPSVPYGPRQNPRRRQGAVAVFLHRALHGEPIEIWGDGEVLRDYFYVDDLSRAVCAAVLREEAVGETLNLGGESVYSLNDVLAVIRDRLGLRPQVVHKDARAFDVPRLHLDSSRAESVLGWQPEVDLGDGIKRTAAWLKRWFE